jgi:hypothetical protein
MWPNERRREDIMMRSFFPSGFMQAADEAFAAFEITPAAGQKRLFVFTVSGMVPSAFPEYAVDGLRTVRMNTADTAHEAVFNERAVLQPPLPPVGGRIEEGASTSYVAWPVRGRVLRDENGQLCEVTARQMRPLGRVARGPYGELLELVRADPVAARPSAEDVIDAEVDEEPVPSPASKTEARDWYAKRARPESTASRCCRLFAEPGLPRVVPIGAFKAILGPQLAHPERLRDTHRLACNLQVYESVRHQSMDELFEAIQRGERSSVAIESLTEQAVARLELAGFLARRPQPPIVAQRKPGFVYPFDRFFRLSVTSDPTRQVTNASQPTARPQAAPLVSPPLAESPPLASAAPTVTTGAKREIPERFQRPWEFKAGRDEVLYDIHVGSTTRHSLRFLWSRIRSWFRSKEEFRKWQTLLYGRSPDEQLWSVRPPCDSFNDPVLREWARRTLEIAGYDAHTMLLEWEVFWRRKGS